MRRLLIDTHVFLWWLIDSDKLGDKARALISDPKNIIYLSAVSSWEVSIKKSLGKLEAPEGIDNIVEEEGFLCLAISVFHGERAGALPSIHRDPFDRMLVAQAQAEGLDIITADEFIPQYGIKTINAKE